MLINIMPYGEEVVGQTYVGTDAAPFKAAFKFIDENGRSGVIRVFPGEYIITQTLATHSDNYIEIRGFSQNSTKILTNHARPFDFWYGSDISFKDISIINLDNDISSTLMRCDASMWLKIVIEKCNIQGYGSLVDYYDTRPSSTLSLIIRNSILVGRKNKISNNSIVKSGNTPDLTVIGNHISNFAEIISWRNKGLFEDNIIQSCGGAGESIIYTGTTNVTLSHNLIKEVPTMYLSSESEFVGNMLINIFDLAFADDDTTLTNTRFSNNFVGYFRYFLKNDRNPMEVRNTTVSGNILYSKRQFDIVDPSGGIENITVFGNAIHTSFQVGDVRNSVIVANATPDGRVSNLSGSIVTKNTFS